MREESIGYLDAYEDKKFLRTCFIETDQYSRALEADTNYICGRRGSGKSAIVMRLQECGKYKHYGEVRGAQFYQQLQSHLRNREIPGLITKHLLSTIWRHLIILSAMNAVIQDYKASDDLPEMVKKIDAYLTEADYKRDSPISLWKDILSGVRSVITGEKVVDDYSNPFMAFVQDRTNEDLFDEAECQLKAYLSRKENRCLVVVDTIIDRFERDDFFVDCVAGLVDAVLEITCQKYSPFLEVKCCIPGEVYPTLKLWEISKVEDHLVTLNWRAKDLIRMISKRLLFYLVRQGKEKDELFQSIDWDDYDEVRSKAWSRYFPDEISNNRSLSEPSWTYVLRHTHLTPRELIRIANMFIRELESGPPFALEGAIRKCVHDSISKTVSELIVSNSFYMSNLEHILETSFGGAQNIMTVREARQAVVKSKSFWKNDAQEPIIEDNVIDWLLQIGFLGVVVTSALPKDHFVKCKFAYLVPERVSLPKDRFLAIHPMFYERFNIAPFDEGKVIYPVKHVDERVGSL